MENRKHKNKTVERQSKSIMLRHKINQKEQVQKYL